MKTTPKLTQSRHFWSWTRRLCGWKLSKVVYQREQVTWASCIHQFAHSQAPTSTRSFFSQSTKASYRIRDSTLHLKTALSARSNTSWHPAPRATTPSAPWWRKINCPKETATPRPRCLTQVKLWASCLRTMIWSRKLTSIRSQKPTLTFTSYSSIR